MMQLKNQFKSTRHFYQSLGGKSFISVKACGEYKYDHPGVDCRFALETGEARCGFDIVEEIRFRGHCITVKGVRYGDWEFGYDDYHGSKRLYIKDRRVVDFLKDNLEEIFRQGGNEYEITPSEGKTRFQFALRHKMRIPAYGVIDPVNGNFLTDVRSEAEAWMRPGCRFVHFSVYYYDRSLKDITPYYNMDGFNYYEVMCDIDCLEDDHCVYPIIATMDGTAPRDAGPKLTRFLLKIRETRPDTPHPGVMVSLVSPRDYEFENFYRGEERCYYLPTTGECMTMEEFYERVKQENCSNTICALMERLKESGETSACSDFKFAGPDSVLYRSQLEMTRTTGAEESDFFVLKVYGEERMITGSDREEGYKQVSEWACNIIMINTLREKLNGLKQKWA